jgi:hypothetical protein
MARGSREIRSGSRAISSIGSWAMTAPGEQVRLGLIVAPL